MNVAALVVSVVILVTTLMFGVTLLLSHPNSISVAVRTEEHTPHTHDTLPSFFLLVLTMLN